MRNVLISFFLISAAVFSSCGTGPENNELKVRVADVSCTEVWLIVQGAYCNELILPRDEKEIQRFRLLSRETTVIDDSLLPKTDYSYRILNMDNGERSDQVIATTLDTTSHKFVWQVYEFSG